MSTIYLREMYAGIGTLTRALQDGFASHVSVEVDGCIELEGRYLEHWARAHRGGTTFRGSAGEYHPAELSIPNGQGMRVFVAGIPCTGTSRAGKSKNRLSSPEEHRNVGYLFLPTCHYVRQHRPEICVFENVPEYRDTLSARVLRIGLERAGYLLTEWTFDSHLQFGCPTQRRRWCMVATRVGKFEWSPPETPFVGTLGSYLDAPSVLDEAEAATLEQIAADKKFLDRKAAENCGFRMRLIDAASRKCPTICRSYGKRQPSATFVKVGDSYRMLRPREVARIHHFPENFELPEARTTAYEALGQGVVYEPFFCLGKALGEWIAEGCVTRRAPKSPVRVGQLQFAL